MNINRRNFLQITGISTLMAGNLFSQQSNKKPNVLFIAVDDLRPELNCYGKTEVKSPNIDKLSKDGIVFERAYCNIPVCGASRASLLTGILPTEKRFINFSTRADKDVSSATTLPQVFKDNGYAAYSFGKVFHHQDDCESKSWSEPAWQSEKSSVQCWLDPETGKKLSKKKKRGRIYEFPEVKDNEYPDGEIADKTIECLRQLKKKKNPFFIASGFRKPHMPFYAPKKYWDLYDRKSIKIADNQYTPKHAPKGLRGSREYKSYYLDKIKVNSEKWHRMMRHGYLACVSFVDAQIGKVLDELKRLKLDENTIVILWGDHGWHLGEHNYWGKHNTLHNALRVPLIIKVPGKKAGKTASFVETVDLFPTLCDLACLPAPEQLHGKSMSALFNNPNTSFRDHIYSRFKKGDAVVTNKYAYTRYSDNGGVMLYDHQKDPGENVNIAGDPSNKEKLLELNDMLQKRIDQANKVKGF